MCEGRELRRRVGGGRVCEGRELRVEEEGGGRM